MPRRKASAFFMSLEDVFVDHPREGGLVMMQLIYHSPVFFQTPLPHSKVKKKKKILSRLTPRASNTQTDGTVSICIHDLQVC